MKTCVRLGVVRIGLALLPLVAPLPAAGATLTVGADGGSPVDPTVSQPLTNMGTAEIYLNLEGPPAEVASVFEGTFSVLVSGFDWSFSIPGSGWDFCEDATDSSSAIVSCTSPNTGGERLVGTFSYTRTGSDPTDSLSIEWTSGFAAKFTDPPLTMPVPISTAPGTVLFTVPEPTTAALLAMGLGLVCVSGARRGRRDQS